MRCCAESESGGLGTNAFPNTYRVWIPDEKKIECSRDVKFLESSYPLTNGYADFLDDDSIIREDTTSEKPGGVVEIESTEFEDRAQEMDHIEEEDSMSEADDSEVENEEEQPEDVATNLRTDETESIQPSRGPGRPRRVLTGRPGRPRKMYQVREVRTDEAESAGM